MITADIEIAKLVYFLYYMKQEDPHAVYGSHTIQEAWNATCFLLNYHPDMLEAWIFKGEKERKK